MTVLSRGMVDFHIILLAPTHVAPAPARLWHRWPLAGSLLLNSLFVFSQTSGKASFSLSVGEGHSLALVLRFLLGWQPHPSRALLPSALLPGAFWCWGFPENRPRRLSRLSARRWRWREWGQAEYSEPPPLLWAGPTLLAFIHCLLFVEDMLHTRHYVGHSRK
jgi:hypothetical protein